MHNAFIGRQPIYDRNLQVYAYELLFRSGEQVNAANHIDANQATSQVIMSSFMEIGIDRIVGKQRAFINLTRDFIVGAIPLPLPPNGVVLEILEDIEADEEVIAGVKNLISQGYTIALDDFVFNDAQLPLLHLVHLIKVELPLLSRAELAEHVHKLKKYNLALLAEKVETQAEYEYCLELGFDYFQGYFFSKPNIITGKRTPANRLATLRILSALQNPNANAAELEALIGQDVNLIHKLLRFINSASFALPRKVESIHQAIVYLGNKTIKHLATLVVLSGVDDKPMQVMVTALVRSKMCELLAQKLNQTNVESYVTAGLLSTLDVLMDQELSELLSELPLSEDVNQALMTHSGPIGQVLACATAYDSGDWKPLSTIDLPPEEIQQCYLDAVTWADETTKSMLTT